MLINHITIHSAEYEKSIEFYKTVAGLKVRNTLSHGGQEITFLCDPGAETAVEIIKSAPEAAYSGAGLSFGFSCEDVAAKRESLAAQGLEPTPMICPAPGVAFFFVKDPNGLTVQFIENK